VELGWSLEGNKEVNRGLSMMKLEPTRRYRVYRKELLAKDDAR
jgi:hypothetical protein